MQLRDEAERVIRNWDAHERARDGRPVIDYDFAPSHRSATQASSRLDVFNDLSGLLARAQGEEHQSIKRTLTAHLAYLRSVLGERPTIERYVSQTQGCSATGWKESYLDQIQDRAQRHLADLGIGWSSRTQDDFNDLEGWISLDDARDRALTVIAEVEPVVRRLAGTDAPYTVRIEIDDVDDYWAYWLDGSGSDARMRFNLRQAIFTENRLKQFAQHELLGHALQCASYAQAASRNDVDWIRLSSVHIPYQVTLEGLAVALPLFTSPNDAQLIARVRLDHYMQLVRGQLHLAINHGQSVEECVAYAQQRVPFWSSHVIGNELSDRSTDPMLRTYLWSYSVGTDWFVALADTDDQALTESVFSAAYERPLSPSDLAILWPSGPLPRLV